MKKKLASLLLVLTFVVQLFVPCHAAGDDIKVLLDGQPISFDSPPEITAGRTMVPMRAIFEAFGYYVVWDAQNRAIKATSADGTSNITMYVDFYTFWKDGQAYDTDVAPYINEKYGRTLVPVRVISTSLGCNVDWSDSERTVYITKDGAEPTASPDVTPSESPSTSASPTPTASADASADPSASPTPTPSPTTSANEGILLNKRELTVSEGSTEELSVASLKTFVGDEKIRWISSDSTIASVTSKGVVAGLEAGTCTITVRAGKEYDTCQVTVLNTPQNPDLEVTAYDTSKLFVDKRNYLHITLRNHGDEPLTINGTGSYQYITGAESRGSTTLYDIYTYQLTCPKTNIRPGGMAELTFTATGAPQIGGQTTKDKFEEAFTFSFDYDGKSYTAKKTKKKSGDTSSSDFTY